MSSASDRVIAALERHKTFLDFADGDFGAELCKAFTDGVLECIAAEQAPDGTTWDELSPEYAASKAKKFPGRPKGVREFHMAQPSQVAGIPDVKSDRAEVAYGIDDLAKAEAVWFQEGDASQNRPPRPFWGFTPSSLAEVKAILDARARQIIR